MASKPTPELVAYSPEKLDEIVQFQNSVAPPHRKMSRSHIEGDLIDFARGHGAHVRLCYEERTLTGYCGWVRGDAGEFFIAPFVVTTHAAARTLLNSALDSGRGQTWARVTCSLSDQEKREAVLEQGFERVFDFVEFEIDPRTFGLTTPVNRLALPPLSSSFKIEAFTRLSSQDFSDLHNESFRGVDNSLPMTETQAEEFLKANDTSVELSFAVRNQTGRAVAYALVKEDGYVDSIGVRPAFQGQNLGTILFARVLSEASRKNLERVFTTVSSRNDASIRLHQRLGFREIERREVFQKNF